MAYLGCVRLTIFRNESKWNNNNNSNNKYFKNNNNDNNNNNYSNNNKDFINMSKA